MEEIIIKILVICGDKRYLSIIEELKKKYQVDSIGLDKRTIPSLKEYNIIIFPITGINQNLELKTIQGTLQIDKNWLNTINPNTIIYTGLITKTMQKYLPNQKIISFLADEEVKKENNLLTKEGILDSIKDLKKDNICLLGYGNIGKLLYPELCQYNLRVGIKEQEDYKELGKIAFFTKDQLTKRAILKQSDLIINTVSEPIIQRQDIENSPAYVLDIASSPYGILEENRKYCQTYRLYPGIPANYAPEKAGKIIAKKLKKDMEGFL